MSTRKLSVLLATAIAVLMTVFGSSSTAQAAGTSDAFLPIGSPCGNTSDFQGSITFEDRGDVFIVHDTCRDGIGVSGEIARLGSDPFVFTDENGNDIGAGRQSINVPRGEEAAVRVCLFDVSTVCESMTIAE